MDAAQPHSGFPGYDGVGGESRSLQERLDYLALSADDQARLRGLAPQFARFSAELVEAFYSHLFAFPSATRFLGDSAVVERLKLLQERHFLSLVEANWDDKYVERRRQVGHSHADVGVDPELFLGAYSRYVQESFCRYFTADERSMSPDLEAMLSLLKVVFLDVGITLEAYFSQATGALRRALDMYWKANVELRQFAHLASHDLKTPLATVANFCEEALDEFGGQMPVGARQLIESARQRTFRMSKMIDELLSVATSFDLATQLAAVSSQEALDDAVERLRPLIQEKRIRLVVPNTLPSVWGDAVRLRESFYNLLSNAVKFSPAESGVVVVTARLSGEVVEFTFVDNGPGIPTDDRTAIFAPFRRSSRTREQAGSGLGLYFAKTMIEYQGGQITVESEVGRGSRFHVTLRRVPSSTASNSPTGDN